MPIALFITVAVWMVFGSVASSVLCTIRFVCNIRLMMDPMSTENRFSLSGKYIGIVLVRRQTYGDG